MPITKAEFDNIKQQYSTLYEKAASYSSAYIEKSSYHRKRVKRGQYWTFLAGVVTGCSGLITLFFGEEAGKIVMAYVTAVMGIITTAASNSELLFKHSENEKKFWDKHRALDNVVDDIEFFLSRVAVDKLSEDEDPYLKRTQLKESIDQNIHASIENIEDFQKKASQKLASRIDVIQFREIPQESEEEELIDAESQSEDAFDDLGEPSYG